MMHALHYYLVATTTEFIHYHRSGRYDAVYFRREHYVWPYKILSDEEALGGCGNGTVSLPSPSHGPDPAAAPRTFYIKEEVSRTRRCCCALCRVPATKHGSNLRYITPGRVRTLFEILFSDLRWIILFLCGIQILFILLLTKGIENHVSLGVQSLGWPGRRDETSRLE
ncbi:hypothetical protein GGR51DRAFT_309438 [Nemania sp. FL0031]|nr:hypothetical protein GGR51DRAFT_309438 [Nemania sp. FL0031]